MEITGNDICQTAEMEMKQGHINDFKSALKSQLERIGTLKKSLKFQEGKLAKLKALSLEQFIEDGR